MSNNEQKLLDIVLLHECAKILATLAETRHVPGASTRLGKGLLDIAGRIKAEVEEDIKNNNGTRKICKLGGTEVWLTRKQYIDRAVDEWGKKMTFNPDLLSDSNRDAIKADAAKIWDEQLPSQKVSDRTPTSNIKKTFTHWGGSEEYTREEFINGAVSRESIEMMQDSKMYSEEYKQDLRNKAAKIWDETK